MIKVLMTGAGAPGGPGIIRCLLKDSEIDLIVADANPNASGRYLNEKYEQIPLASDSDFIDKVLFLCAKHDIDVIFPLVTRELFKFSEVKDLFYEKGIKVIVSDYEDLKIANDKSALNVHLKKHNVITPDFFVAKTYEDVEEAFNKLGYPENSVCIKPSISNGSRGVRIIDDHIDEFDLLFNHKPTSLYMSMDKLKSLLKGREFPELLVSEMMPGEEYTVDTLISKNKVEVIIPRKRTKINGGISVAGEFVNQKEIIHYCNEIIGTMNLFGPIGIQVKKSKEGVFKILEINPRIQGTSVAALGAGINLPLLAVYSALGRPFDIPEVKWGTRFVRYYDEVYF